jgi:S-adenosylmethionine/arginine decarboxylase-like enzyme
MSQIIIDGLVENGYYINNEENIHHYMDLMASIFEMKVIHRYFHRFEPCGITACYVLAESHFCVHTYPEKKIISIDMSSCKEYTEETMRCFEIYSKILLKIKKILNLQRIKRIINGENT